MNSKMRTAPSIRFSGFDDVWQRSNLASLSDKLEYGMNAAAIPFDGENQYIRITDIDDASRKYIVSSRVSPSGELCETYRLRECDILFARTGASTGKSYIYHDRDGKMYFAGYLIRATIKPKVSAQFVFYNTLTNRYNNWVKMMSVRSGQPGINANEYGQYLLYVPSLPEQQNIASFLSLIDAKIDKQSAKVYALEEYKKGLLQKIFSQEIRFKDDDANDYPEWEVKQFGDVYTFLKTNSFSRDQMTEEYGSIHIIHYGDIHMKYSTILDVSTTALPYLNKQYEKSDYIYCRNKDILIADASEDYLDIGKSIELRKVGNLLIIAGLHTILARDKTNTMCDLYGGYMMQSIGVHKQIRILAAGAKVLGLSRSNLARVLVPIPNKEERKK